MKKPTKKDLLAEFDSVQDAADRIGVSRQTFWKWPNKLNDSALRRIRDYYLKKDGVVPARWMP